MCHAIRGVAQKILPLATGAKPKTLGIPDGSVRALSSAWRSLCVCEHYVPIDYKGRRVRGGLKLDLLIEGCVVVELTAVEALHPVHSSQVLTYLRLTGFPAGLLMNFNVTSLRAGLRRLDHPDRPQSIISPLHVHP